MQRGKHTLYNNIVPTSIPDDSSAQKKRNTGIDDRRDAMAHRYYYHAVLRRLRFDDCLLNLSQEFFLQPATISIELHQRHDLINSLVKANTKITELRKLYPFFNWQNKTI